MTACGKRLRASISRRRWMVSELPANSEKGMGLLYHAGTEKIALGS
jgi:hypothetical protein